MTTEVNGTLEIDHGRGVIYFHSSDPNCFGGVTLLRICGLPKPIPKAALLDITHLYGASWDKHTTKRED